MKNLKHEDENLLCVAEQILRYFVFGASCYDFLPAKYFLNFSNVVCWMLFELKLFALFVLVTCHHKFLLPLQN